MPRLRILSVFLAVAFAAVAVASAASGADAPATFRLAFMFSPLHESEPGVVPDSHWSMVRKADPADPCSVAVSIKGKQRITFGLNDRPGERAPLPVVLLTFHPDGRLMTETWPTADLSRPGTVTAGTFALPASVTRKDEIEIGKPSSGCIEAGDGGGVSPPPVGQGGCGTAKGTMHLRLSMAGKRLRITGRFVSIFGRNLFSRCLLFPEEWPAPPEKRLELIDTTWPICEGVLEKPSASGEPVFDLTVRTLQVGARETCSTSVHTRRKGGFTLSSYWIALNRVKHGPAG